jgi:hypothetical protein
MPSNIGFNFFSRKRSGQPAAPTSPNSPSSTATDSGTPREEDKPLEEYPEDLTCPICYNLFDEPCTLPSCQHAFCRMCIKKCVESKMVAQCPVCRSSSNIAPGTAQADVLCSLPVDEELDARIAEAYPRQHAESIARRKLDAYMEESARTVPIMSNFEPYSLVHPKAIKKGSTIRLHLSEPGHLLMLAHCLTKGGGENRRFGLLGAGQRSGFVVGIMTPGLESCATLGQAQAKVAWKRGSNRALTIQALVIDQFKLLSTTRLGLVDREELPASEEPQIVPSRQATHGQALVPVDVGDLSPEQATRWVSKSVILGRAFIGNIIQNLSHHGGRRMENVATLP